MPTRKEDFTTRWSRLKREKQAEAQTATTKEIDDQIETIEETVDDVPAKSEKPDSELTDSELLVKYKLPDPDAMKAGDDFSVFMKQAIPDRLRRRALRVLWGSNPILANLDELVDYGEDFTDAATVMENMPTIYKVGKGAAWKFKEEQERVAAEKAAEEAEAAERRLHNGEPEEEDLALEEPDEEIESEEPEDIEPETELAALTEEDSALAPPLPPKPRAMRFEFD